MKKETEGKIPLYRKRRFWVAAIAALLAFLLILVLVVTAVNTAKAVVYFDKAVLREDTYRYLLACYKYVYLVRYKDLNISDTPSGWQAVGADGETYEETFYREIDREICMRFVAASLFDAYGYTLDADAYEALDETFDVLKTEAFGEKGFSVLKKDYGIGKGAVKTAGLYEKKYQALYEMMFASPDVIYAEEYREELSRFYERFYMRYNMIYVSDEVGASHREAVESAIADGVTETEFTMLEKNYSTLTDKVTSGKYPNGIYLYAGTSYENAFSAELLSAFREADEVGKVVAKRDKNDAGTYYVMRYALDKEPYRLDDEKVKACFRDLPDFAGQYIYRAMLSGHLAELRDTGIRAGYTVAGIAPCRTHNIVNLLSSR